MKTWLSGDVSKRLALGAVTPRLRTNLSSRLSRFEPV
jgi:hypothetical protein